MHWLTAVFLFDENSKFVHFPPPEYFICSEKFKHEIIASLNIVCMIKIIIDCEIAKGMNRDPKWKRKHFSLCACSIIQINYLLRSIIKLNNFRSLIFVFVSASALCRCKLFCGYSHTNEHLPNMCIALMFAYTSCSMGADDDEDFKYRLNINF